MKCAFTHANVIDVLEHRLIEDCAILTEDGKITQILSGGTAPANYSEVDLTGKYLAPGLFNCHVHSMVCFAPDGTNLWGDTVFHTLSALENLQSYVRSGVVFVRDVGGGSDSIPIELKKAIDSGRIINAPDMQVCGQPICMTGGTTWQFIGYQADGEDGVRTAARLMLRRGANLIKLMGTGGVVTPGNKIEAPHLNEKELRAAVEEAHNAGVRATCHVHNNTGALNAIRAGVDCLEHGTALSDEAIQMMVKKGIYLDATLAATYSIIRSSKNEEFTRKAKVAASTAVDTFRRAHAAGVRCVSGTDCGTEGCFHTESALELVLMVEQGGVDPFEAFAIATINSAEICDVADRLGSVSVGKDASFAVFDQNPIADIHAAQDCVMTIKNGRIIWEKETGFSSPL